MSKSPVKLCFLIHGWGGSVKSLEGLAKELSGGNGELKVINLELPGFGETPLDRSFTFSDYCNYVSNSIAKAYSGDGSDVLLLGHSFGGQILMQLTSDGFLPLAKVVLINTSGLKPRNGLKVKLFKLLSLIYKPLKYVLNITGLGKLQELIRKALYKYVVRARDYEKATNPLLQKTLQNILSRNLSVDVIRKIKQHTLIIWGENDTDTPLWMGEELHRLISNSQFQLVSGATHGLPLKNPQVCAQIINDWL